ncbi:MAG TPA: hypothetical protein VF483_09655 [Gemmatimonadaceae bacterium]
MRRISVALLSLATVASTAIAQDAANKVAGGGITLAGWQGALDKGEKMALSDSKLEAYGNGAMHVVTGPAVTYWNPKNVASGNYTVKATFHEPKFQGLNDHPHPYGIMIGGNDLGTDNASMLYCAAYGSGKFIVRGFAPGATRRGGAFYMNAGGEANAAIHTAAVGSEVQQEIAIQVTADKVNCIINGTTVGSYNKSDVVGAGKLKSTDGVYGIRFAHNTEAHVSGFTMTKQ